MKIDHKIKHTFTMLSFRKIVFISRLPLGYKTGANIGYLTSPGYFRRANSVGSRPVFVSKLKKCASMLKIAAAHPRTRVT